MLLHRVVVFEPFGLKTGIGFAHFAELSMVFEGITGVYEHTFYHFNSKLE